MSAIRGAIIAVGIEVVFSGVFVFSGAHMHGIAQADVPPICDQPQASLCTFDVELDGAAYVVKGCDHEDGNPDALPCLWRDPDTGAMFYVTSENYR